MVSLRPVRERTGPFRVLGEGQSLSAISLATGLDRKTVQRFARAQRVDELLVRAVTREAKIDVFKPYLCQRWNEGARDASVLNAELPVGWVGSVQTVRCCVAPFRKRTTPAEPPPIVPRTARSGACS